LGAAHLKLMESVTAIEADLTSLEHRADGILP
jgi:hypothetical protein